MDDPTDRVAEPDSADRAVSTARTVTTIVLVAVTMILLMATTVALWAQAVVFDSERVGDIVGDALAEPEVEAALADYVTEQVFSAVDIEAVVHEALPADLQRIEPAIVAGVQSAVDRGVTRALSEPEVQNVMTELVERAHRRAMDVLQGDGLTGAVSAVEGEVSINLLPLIGRGLTRLQALGLLDNLDVPELAADGDPSQQIADLESATGRDLPEDFGQLVVYQSDELADRQATLDSAQRIVALAKRAVWVLAVLTIAFAVATVLVARNHWKAALWLGLGGVVAMAIVRSAARRVVDDAPDLAERPGGKAAISAIVSAASTSLLRLAAVLLVLAAGTALFAMFRRGWRRGDVALGGAVLAFVLIVALVGFSIVSLLLGVIAAVIVTIVVKRSGGVATRASALSA